MFAQHRRFDICSIGNYMNKRSGRPCSVSGDDDLIWVQMCNFVCKTIACVCSLDSRGESNDECNSGWILKVMTMDKRSSTVYLRNEDITNNAYVKKCFMRSLSGLVCRMTADDVLRFIDQDSKEGLLSKLPRYVTSQCGKVYVPSVLSADNGKKRSRWLWIFPGIILDEDFKKVCMDDDECRIFLSLDGLKGRKSHDSFTLPSEMPCPVPIRSLSISCSRLVELSRCMKAYYGPRFMQAFHVLSSVLKAVLFDVLLSLEHGVSILNLSGPPNIGKTFSCCIALSVLSCESLLLSRCTMSSMLDFAHVFKNMLVVFDDPRDISDSQMSSIVHEAYNGHSSSTISKGVRRYNSALTIGTQDRCLNLSNIHENVPTFSRLSHVDMNLRTDYVASQSSERALKKTMRVNRDIFGYLVDAKYSVKKTDVLYNNLERISKGMIIPRALRSVAIDWQLCDILKEKGFEVDDCVMKEYFEKTQVEMLCDVCCKMSKIDRFLQYLCLILNDSKILKKFGPLVLKPSCMIDLKNVGPIECVALYPKDFFELLHSLFPDSKSISKECVAAEIKKMGYERAGEVSKNVSYKLLNGSFQIKRSYVIRKDVLEKNAK